MLSRRNFVRLTAAGMAGSFANAAWIEPDRLTITRQDIPCKKLPPALDGLRICLLADFHFRPGQDDELLAEAVAQANQEKPKDIMLQLSGHTHGGQCRVPFTGYAPVGVRYGRKYVYGGFHRGNSSLFVTRGVGTTGLRVRFACPPELAVLTLRVADQEVT